MQYTTEQLKEILRLHKLWLEGKDGGVRANLRGADLQHANLGGADLRKADLDYSCWPLWCGSLGAIVDDAIVGQLLFHVFSVAKSSGINISTIKRVKEVMGKGSPVKKHGKKVSDAL